MVKEKMFEFDKVQVWKGNTMLSAQLSSVDAERMVKEGKAKRINNQAIYLVA